jgi:hypothetical protein
MSHLTGRFSPIILRTHFKNRCCTGAACCAPTGNLNFEIASSLEIKVWYFETELTRYPPNAAKILCEGDVLDGEVVLLGFKLDVSSIISRI